MIVFDSQMKNNGPINGYSLMPSQEKSFAKRPCALLWDESFLWGLMARRALRDAGLPFDLIRSDEIKAGALSRYGMLFVPGGDRKSVV